MYLSIVSIVEVPAIFNVSESHCELFAVFVHFKGLLPRWPGVRKPFLFF